MVTDDFQISTVLSQREWYGNKGTINDCWVMAPSMCVLATTPWVTIPGITVFRANAGDPEDGVTDGGAISEIIRGVETTWPIYKDKLKGKRNAERSVIVNDLDEGRALSIRLMIGALPQRLRYTTSNVAHECALLKKNGEYRFANPLAPMPSRWDTVNLEDILPAMRAYTNGNGHTYVRFPTILEMLQYHPAYEESLGEAFSKAFKNGEVAGWNSALAHVQQLVDAIPNKEPIP